MNRAPRARLLRRGPALMLAVGAALLLAACGTGTTTGDAGHGTGTRALDGSGAGTGGGYRGGVGTGTTTGGGWGGGQGAVGAGNGVGGGNGAGGYGAGGGDVEPGGDVADRVADLPIATLTQAEIDGLVYMREEEKLAHDVYIALGETWGSRVFANISRSETVHADAVKTLLDRYGIADPSAGKAAGTFSAPELQALYDQLVARGRTSVTEAYTVGALIEELDIHDLRDRATTTPDIALVYADLEAGSENHLRAFTRNLERQGASYSPTYLSPADYEQIIGSPSTSGLSS